MSRKKLILTAIILALVLAIGGILAYFTDVDTKVNKFKMGNVDIEVIEPSWPGNPDTPGEEDKPVEDIVPNQEIPKDPQIINKGSNDIYAFAEVSVPYENIILEGQTAATDKELFTYTVNPGWIEVGTASKDTAKKTFTHVYAYVGKEASDINDKVKALKKNETTPAVFDKIKFIDIHETGNTTSSVQTTSLEVVVSGYGIQTTDLGTESTNPSDIWQLVKSVN